MEVRILENIYKMLVKSRKLYGVEIWGTYEACKHTDAVHGKFSMGILDVSKCTANGTAELELGRDI
jgi:hypothetical protein